MARESHWRKASRRKLNEILLSTPTRQEGESLESWGKRLKKAIADGYPFALRSGFAYQCWTDERRKLLVELGLAQPVQRKGGKERSRPDEVAPGQLSFF